jgi:Heavy metal binding domain
MVLLSVLLAMWLAVQTETFACPMHPEIQAATVGTCRVCGMALLKRTEDPAAPEYVMNLEPTWGDSSTSGRLLFRFKTEAGRPAGRFQLVHERELHVFVVSRDLRFFEHAHPTAIGAGEFRLAAKLPEAGEYMVFADFVPVGAFPQFLQQLIVTPGFRGRMEATGLEAQTGDQVVGDLRFSLKVEEFRASTPSLLTFSVFDASTGLPVQDLESYLGASGHLFFTNADFTDATHSHPLESKSGSAIRFLTRFNTPGMHRIWLQVQRRNRVVTAVWTLDVPPPRRLSPQ